MCFKCQGFGHISKICKNKGVCSIYVEKKHSHRNCPSKEDKTKQKKCGNCKKAGRNSNHNVMDRKCPMYVKQLERIVYNTDYVDGNELIKIIKSKLQLRK